MLQMLQHVVTPFPHVSTSETVVLFSVRRIYCETFLQEVLNKLQNTVLFFSVVIGSLEMSRASAESITSEHLAVHAG